MKRGMNQEIYTRAAELIDDGTQAFSCIAIGTSAEERGICGNKLIARYAFWISPVGYGAVISSDFTAANPGDDGEARGARRDHRVIALLMAAQAARTGDL